MSVYGCMAVCVCVCILGEGYGGVTAESGCLEWGLGWVGLGRWGRGMCVKGREGREGRRGKGDARWTSRVCGLIDE